MRLKQVVLKNFRCFSTATFDLDAKIVLICGKNGSGKSSLLEALHYLCYLRSFRATSPRDLVRFGSESFFVKAQFCSFEPDRLQNDLQVGFTAKKRLVKLNQKPVVTFKQLLDHYKVVTIAEDDLDLIKAGPDVRRQFIDHAILLEDPQYAQDVRVFKQVLQNRNSLLQRGQIGKESHQIWTKQLWEQSRVLWRKRDGLVKKLQKRLCELLMKTFPDEKLSVSMTYKVKKVDPERSFKDFIKQCDEKRLFLEEQRFCRSLFGAHLDDILIEFQSKKSKQYASRGQQKLIVFLLKIASSFASSTQEGLPVLLLDDFMTDFDEKRVEKLVHFIEKLPNQAIFTSPAAQAPLNNLVLKLGAKQVDLTI